MKKIFVSDIDGTLIPFKKNFVSKENINSIKKNKYFFDFILATGLPINSYVDNVIKKVSPKFVIYSGGGVILDYENNKVLYNKEIDLKNFEKITKIILSMNLFFTNSNRKKYYYFHKNPDKKIISDFKKIYNTDFKKINLTKFNKIFKSKNRIHIMGSKNNIKLVIGILNKINKINFIFDKKSQMIINIMHSESSKKNALLFLEKYLNFDFKKNSACIGDSELDIEMLKMSKISFSLKDSTKSVQKQVDYVVSESYNNGFSEAVKIAKKNML